MKYKKWPQEVWDKIQSALDKTSKLKKRVAAFDADGTLWDTDLGEAFFKYQIKHHLIEDLPTAPWEHYRKWKESGDPRPAYLWLAQINKGHKLEQARKWAEECVRQFDSLPIFDDQAKLIELLQANNVEVYIVTASVKWAVEPGAKRLNVPIENVIGISTKIKNGLISDQQEGEITYREGKVKALLNVTDNVKPFFCSGNTMGDLALLESSLEISMAVGAAKENHELYSTEERLRQEATSRGWLIHHF